MTKRSQRRRRPRPASRPERREAAVSADSTAAAFPDLPEPAPAPGAVLRLDDADEIEDLPLFLDEMRPPTAAPVRSSVPKPEPAPVPEAEPVRRAVPRSKTRIAMLAVLVLCAMAAMLEFHFRHAREAEARRARVIESAPAGPAPAGTPAAAPRRSSAVIVG